MDRTAMWDICNANAHLVHALAQGYMELYYVNLETGEYSEYHTKDDKEILTEARHGIYATEPCSHSCGRQGSVYEGDEP